MPIKHDNPLDALMQLGVKRKYFVSATSTGFDNINDWIESLIDAVQKKDAQYEALKNIKDVATDTLLNDFQTLVGMSYEEWQDKRAKELLEGSK